MEQKESLESLCSNVNCNYPGSYCSVENGIAKCVCDSINCVNDEIEVCGQDGQTYASKCDLIKLSCSRQIQTEVAYNGKCSQGMNFSFRKINSVLYFYYKSQLFL